MKFVMPLHDGYSTAGPFEFSDGLHSIRPFNIKEHDNLGSLFSDRDRNNISKCHHALVLEGDEVNNGNLHTHLGNSELLILSCRAFGNAGFFYKYRICVDTFEYHSILNEPMRWYHQLDNNRFDNPIVNARSRGNWIEVGSLQAGDRYYPHLLEMWEISNRTRNALYFTLKGSRSGYWADSFLAYMIAIDALLSSDGNRSMTKTVSGRASRLLKGKPHCSYDEIHLLYDIRSEIVHGKIPTDGLGNSDDNIIATAHAELVLVEIMKKLIDDDIYPNYAHPNKIQNYLGHLKP